MMNTKNFFEDRSGTMAALAAAGLVASAAAAAVAVDVGQIYAVRSELEITTDAAALAAATKLHDLALARATAVRYAAKNMPTDKYGIVVTENDVRFGHWDVDRRIFIESSDLISAVKVNASYKIGEDSASTLFFAPIFGIDWFDVKADAVAGTLSPPCIFIMEPTADTSFILSDQASIETKGCGVQVNSENNTSLSMEGSSSMITEAACASGGVNISGAATAIPHPKEFCPSRIDPLADHQALVAGVCNENDLTVENQTKTLLPGVYCGGIMIRQGSDVTMAPGNYIIKDGPLEVRENSALKGEDVHLQFDGELAVSLFRYDSTIRLSAPKSGDNVGILMFQDWGFFGAHRWNSENIEEIIGTIYFRDSDLLGSSEAPMTALNSCNVIVVDGLRLSNGSSMSIDVTDSECQNSLPAPFRTRTSLLN